MPRILKPNDTNTIPGAIVIVEVATTAVRNKLHPDRTDHTLKCWTAISGRMEGGKWTREKLKAGTSGPDFWSYVNVARQAGHPITLCGFSIGQSASMLGFWTELESGQFRLSLNPTSRQIKANSLALRRKPPRTLTGLLITNGPPTAVICWHKDRWKLTILDVSNFLDKPMPKLAELTGLPLPEWPLPDAPLESFQDVCAARCRIVRDVFVKMVEWQNRQELGRFSITISSLALAAFRHRFMRDRIELPDDQDERDWEREGYFNGRVEAFWTGKIQGNRYTPAPGKKSSGTLFDDYPVPPFHVVDARSFYAAVATFEQVPIRCVESHITGHVPRPPSHADYGTIMATVTINTHDDTYPVRREAGAVFARGQYQTTLCGPELVRAVKAGHVVNWHGWRQYELAPALRWFAEGIWAERIKAEGLSDLVIAALCKSLMARLHGKWLQRAHRWTLLPGRVAPGPWEHWSSIDAVTGTVRHFRSVGWDVQIKDDAGDAEHCFPAIAAWVTSHGREYLRYWMKVAGPRNVLYCGCDSLIVTDAGLANLKRHGYFDPPGVGSLRVTGTANDIEIRGPNNYRHGDREAVAGRASRELRIIQRRWTAERQQGLEEIFLNSDRSRVTNYTVGGNVANYNTPGTVGAGGWIDPPTLTMETFRCPTKLQTEPKSLPELLPTS